MYFVKGYWNSKYFVEDYFEGFPGEAEDPEDIHRRGDDTRRKVGGAIHFFWKTGRKR